MCEKAEIMLRLKEKLYISPELSSYVKKKLEHIFDISRDKPIEEIKYGIILKIELPGRDKEYREEFRERLGRDAQNYLDKIRAQAMTKRKTTKHMLRTVGIKEERMAELLDCGRKFYTGENLREDLRIVPELEVRIV